MKKLKLITESNLEDFEVITESETVNKPQTIKMRGVYLTSNVKNGNNRVYPYEELKRTVDRFIEEKIKTKTALEELEHPECHLSPNFEVLTENGFRWFSELKIGDLVWTRNPNTKKSELKPIKKIISQNYKGNGYIVTGKNIYGEYTANHRVITEDQYGNVEISTIEDIYNNRSHFHNNKIPKTIDIYDDQNESSDICMDEKSMKIEKIEVKEDDQYGAYCIQVDNQSFFMRIHGKSYWTGNCTTINPDRVCCRTLSLVEDNKSWIGESVVMASDEKFGIKGTKCGDLLKSLLQFDTAIGHSSRGVGNVNESSGIVEDYQLICIDTVLNPSIGIFNQSNATRFVNGILESKQFIVNTHGEILEETFENFEKDLSKFPNTHITSNKVEYIGNAVMKFLDAFRR